VLGLKKEQLGRQDNFFEIGGTSLSALKLAIALDRALSFKDLIAHPILAHQAELIDQRFDLEVSAADGIEVNSRPANRAAASPSPVG
jgi:hypothetical protein